MGVQLESSEPVSLAERDTRIIARLVNSSLQHDIFEYIISLFYPDKMDEEAKLALITAINHNMSKSRRDYFLEKYARENNKHITRISAPAIEMLTSYHWPGNVRELENCVERMATMTKGNLIRRGDLLCQKGLCFSSALKNYGTTHPSIPIFSEPDHYPEIPSRAAAAEPPVPHDEAEPLAERERLMWAMEKTLPSLPAKFTGNTTPA